MVGGLGLGFKEFGGRKESHVVAWSVTLNTQPCRGTSLIRNHPPAGPWSRSMPMVLGVCKHPTVWVPAST